MNAIDAFFQKSGGTSPSLSAAPAPPLGPELPAPLSRRHLARLRQIYRSSGWPCRDITELELVVAGFITPRESCTRLETLELTHLGRKVLVESSAANRASRSAHDELSSRVTRYLQADGRIVWNEIALRANVDGEWLTGVADVFSIRHTTVEAYLDPVVHEVKVSRSDLLQDLRSPAKRGAYLGMASQVYYVLACGPDGKAIAQPDEIPLECGVIIAEQDRLNIARVAPRQPFTGLRFDLWMSLAKASPVPPPERGDHQLLL